MLSLARDGEAYGVPVSFGYDGTDRLYFVFLRVGEESRKEAFAASTERASFTADDVESKHVWRSVIVHGRIREVADDEWETVRESIDDNAWYPSLFSEAEPMRDIQGWVLEIEETTGQKNGADRRGRRNLGVGTRFPCPDQSITVSASTSAMRSLVSGL